MKALKKMTVNELLSVTGGKAESTGCVNTIYTDASEAHPCGDVRKVYTFDGDGADELETLDFTLSLECVV